MRVRVPLPWRSREQAYGGASEEEISAAVKSASYRRVPLSMLRKLQISVKSDRVEQYEANPAMPSPSGSPLIVEREGRLYIRNGHHRATAAIRRGERTLAARVAHLGPSSPMLFHEHGHAGDLLMIDPRAMAASYRQRDVQDVAEIVGDVAVVSIDGPLESKAGSSWWCYFDDYESILERFRCAAESDDVRAILLKIDSPGGSAAGLNECVDAMLRCKAETGKPVFAYVDEGAYSAAYAVACVADEIYLPRAGGVGSIGVISQLVDWTKANEKDGVRVEVITSGARKADFNPNVPISGAAIARLQSRVMQLAKIYWKLVKDTRGVSAKKLEANTFYGADAVKLGLADGVLSLDALMAAIPSALDKTPKARSTLAHGTRAAAQRGTASEGSAMTRILALTAAVKSATAALASAGKKEHAAKEAELALAEAALGRELAKVTKDKKTVTHVHESESESESESSSSGSSSSSSESESESESEAAAESESESESESEEAIVALARRITGKSSAREVLGALEAMRDTAHVGPKAAKQLAKLTAERATRRVEDLIAAGKASHKITPGNESKARKIAAKHGHRALASFIDAAMPAINPSEIVEAEEIEGGVTITSEQKKIWTKLGHKEADFPKLAKAQQKEQMRLANGGPPARGGL